MQFRSLSILAALLLSSCVARPPSPAFTHEIRDVATWNALAARPQSSVTARTEIVKFIRDLEDGRIWFVDTERYPVHYFFVRPSTGAACKRLNLFLRWMVRRDGVDPGGWTAVGAGQLIVPLDTHTIRIGRCLRLTRRQSPGWKMAVEITDALRAIDPDDPVRYDFSLCHLSMMGACGYGTRRGSAQCPLREHCRPTGGKR